MAFITQYSFFSKTTMVHYLTLFLGVYEINVRFVSFFPLGKKYTHTYNFEIFVKKKKYEK